MTSAVIPYVFQGDGDNELITVDLPLAYLRFLVSIRHYSTLWLDENYNQAQATSEQWSLIEEGVRRATIGANGDMDANRISQLTGLGQQDAGLLAFWPMSRSPDTDFRDISGHGLHLSYGSDTGVLPDHATDDGLPYAKLGGGGVPTQLYTNNTAFHAVGKGLTVSAWIRPGQTGTDQRIFQNQADGANRYFAWITSNTARLVINNTGISNPTTIPQNEWAYVCYRWTPSASMDVWTGLDSMTKATLTTAVPASIGSFTAFTYIGTTSSLLDISNLRFATRPVPDVAIERYFMATKRAFRS